MIETDLVNEVVIEGYDIKGLRLGKTLYPSWKGAEGVRVKCRVDDLVFKLESGDEQGQTYNEAMFSSKIQGPDRKYFVEVIHTGTAKDSTGRVWRWVAQPYVDVVAHPVRPDDVTLERCRKKLNELTDRYCLEDMGGFGKNWTILNNELLIYDYGFSRVGDRAFKKT